MSPEQASGAARRPPRRHLRARHHHVRDVHGPRALRGRHVHGRPHAAHVRPARPAQSGERRGRGARRARADHSRLPREEAGGSLRIDGGPGRRPRPGRPGGRRRGAWRLRLCWTHLRTGHQQACATGWPTSSSLRRSRKCGLRSTASPRRRRGSAGDGSPPRGRTVVAGIAAWALAFDAPRAEPPGPPASSASATVAVIVAAPPPPPAPPTLAAAAPSTSESPVNLAASAVAPPLARRPVGPRRRRRRLPVSTTWAILSR